MKRTGRRGRMDFVLGTVISHFHVKGGKADVENSEGPLSKGAPASEQNSPEEHMGKARDDSAKRKRTSQRRKAVVKKKGGLAVIIQDGTSREERKRRGNAGVLGIEKKGR